MLVLPNAASFPLEALPALRGHLSRGGHLVLLGGHAFSHLFARDGAGGWEERTTCSPSLLDNPTGQGWRCNDERRCATCTADAPMEEYAMSDRPTTPAPRLARDPLFACCIMFPTDRELAAGIRDIDLGPFPEASFQGFPLRAARVVRRRRDPRVVAGDLAACGFNAALIVGFCGANFLPEDVRGPRFRALVAALKGRGMAVGVCIPFADTVDNTLTRADPRMHQRRHDGKRPFVRFDPDIERPPFPIFIVDYGCAAFVAFARAIVRAARDAGCDFIDFAEPDYWPTDHNGYGAYLEAAWRRATNTPLPFPSTLPHRLFMEDYHLAAVRKISAFAHRNGLRDHLTASPLGHAPYHVCQNYGKYATTGITELSSTYHFLYGLAWKERLAARYGIDVAPHRFSSLGCMEVRSMRGWGERHATYLVPGQSLPASTYASAIDQQMFLQNMDVVFWEYPSIRQNYYETDDPVASPAAAWRRLRGLFSEKARAYRALPSAYHAAMPSPEALVLYSKRGAYAGPADDPATPCAYATTLRLMRGVIQPLFLYPEHLAPLSSPRCSPRILLVDEHHPLPSEAWDRIAAWLACGSRVLLYGGGPGLDNDTGAPLPDFPPGLPASARREGRPAARPVPRGDLSRRAAPGRSAAAAGVRAGARLHGHRPRIRPALRRGEDGGRHLACRVRGRTAVRAARRVPGPAHLLAPRADRGAQGADRRADGRRALPLPGNRRLVACGEEPLDGRAGDPVRGGHGLEAREGPRVDASRVAPGEEELRAVEFGAGRVAFSNAPEANCVRIYEIARSRS